MKPYGLISDTHHHGWSAFATINEHGVNSRLQMLLDETTRCGDEVLAAGGDTIIHAGDLFHVRGSIAPSVLNPTMAAYKSLIAKGLRVIILAGNHDLEGKESNRVGSAITALEDVGCEIANAAKSIGGHSIHMIPWCQNINELKDRIEAVDLAQRPETDLILHAPIDGVILGIPDHGLDAVYLASLGFKRVFAGHYHNHKDLGNGIYSIGALAHHTWSDIGSKAGFLLVGDKDVTWRSSRAPAFVEISADTDPDTFDLIADGNYVRAKLNTTKQSDVESTRQYLLECGAKGVVILAQPDVTVSARTGGATITAGASLEVSVTDFIKAQSYPNQEALAVLCNDILNEARGA